MYRVLICGGRDYYDHSSQDDAEEYIKSCLVSLLEPPEKEDVIFISGMARGADQIPINMLELDPEWGGVDEFPADWELHGRRAGPIRNIEMLEVGKPDMVIAFPTPTSKGTWHMVKISKEAGVPVYVYD